MNLRAHASFANVMSIIALFIALGGGAYAAVELAKVKRNSVGTKQLKNNAVTSAKVKDASLTGGDIKEPSLGEVPSAGNASKLGGADPSAYLGTASSGYQAAICDPGGPGAFTDCAGTTLNLPRSGQVMLIAAGGQNSFGPSEGTCQFRIDGVTSSIPSVEPGEQATDNTSSTSQNGFAMTAVTGSLAAGNHSFSLTCVERIGDVELFDTTISALLVG